jgi:hypothetical protein
MQFEAAKANEAAHEFALCELRLSKIMTSSGRSQRQRDRDARSLEVMVFQRATSAYETTQRDAVLLS